MVPDTLLIQVFSPYIIFSLGKSGNPVSSSAVPPPPPHPQVPKYCWPQSALLSAQWGGGGEGGRGHARASGTNSWYFFRPV